MSNHLSSDNLEMNDAFEVILTIQSFSDHLTDIVEMIYKKELSKENLLEILEKHEITDIRNIKEELLDLLLIYINLVLNDHIISEKEKYNVEILKLYFKIREGDFYRLRYDEVQDVIQRQFKRIYLDNKITIDEAMHSVDLQDVFDLSYDQFDEFKEKEVSRALKDGADILELDTVRIPKTHLEIIEDTHKELSEELKYMAWKRDQDKCQKCGAVEDLFLYPIIPLHKGGSMTTRNIITLCLDCITNEK